MLSTYWLVFERLKMKASKEAVWAAVYGSQYTHWIEGPFSILREEAHRRASLEADLVVSSRFAELPLESPEDVKIERYRGSPELAIVTDNAESAIIVRRADAEKLAALLLRFAKEDKL